MKRSNLFWGILLVLLGSLFLLERFKIIQNVLDWFFPLAFILAGVMVLLRKGRRTPDAPLGADSFSIPLQAAARVDLEIEHGAGAIHLNGKAGEGQALVGTSGHGLEQKYHLGENGLGIELKAGPTFLPFMGPDGGEWQFSITPAVPVSISIEAGASSLDLDLTDLKLTFLRLKTGASSIKCHLPKAGGRSLVEFESGMANIELVIPAGVAGRIRLEQGASAVTLDKDRFKLLASNPTLYQSDDFDTAENKVEINLEGGANAIDIRNGAGNE